MGILFLLVETSCGCGQLLAPEKWRQHKGTSTVLTAIRRIQDELIATKFALGERCKMDIGRVAGFFGWHELGYELSMQNPKRQAVLEAIRAHVRTWRQTFELEELMSNFSQIFSESEENATCAMPTCRCIGRLRCGGCKGLRYCSKECQRADWKHHRVACHRSSVSPLSTQENSSFSPSSIGAIRYNELTDCLQVASRLSTATGDLKGLSPISSAPML
jgi:hypothetical protein